jgi:hypothetical protein
VLEFRAGYVKAGALDKALDNIRWGAEFMIRSHISEYQFVAQVGGWAGRPGVRLLRLRLRLCVRLWLWLRLRRLRRLHACCSSP